MLGIKSRPSKANYVNKPWFDNDYAEARSALSRLLQTAKGTNFAESNKLEFLIGKKKYTNLIHKKI